MSPSTTSSVSTTDSPWIPYPSAFATASADYFTNYTLSVDTAADRNYRQNEQMAQMQQQMMNVPQPAREFIRQNPAIFREPIAVKFPFDKPPIPALAELKTKLQQGTPTGPKRPF